MTWRSRAAQGLAIVLLGTAGGCSLGGGDDKPAQPARGVTKQVAELVAALEHATRSSDWRTVCDRLFTRSARKRAGGKDCARLLRAGAGDLSGARIELRKIKLGPRAAEVELRSRARGQPLLTDTLEVVRERGRYRIDALR